MVAITWLGAAPAQAATTEEIVASLKDDPVYVDPAADVPLTSGQADDLRGELAQTGLPFFIAVTPQEPGTTASQMLRDIQQGVGEPGTYALIAGEQFRARSTQGSVDELATRELQAHRSEGAYSVLSAFLGASAAELGGTVPTGGVPPATGERQSAPWGLLTLLGVAAVVVAIVMARSAHLKRQRSARELREVRGVIDADVTEFGERLADYDMTDDRLDRQGMGSLIEALDSYDKAKAATETLSSPAGASVVTGHLEDGRYALACVSARLEGEPVPARRPPCFIDPRHGPSTSDVRYMPSGSDPREIPVCVVCSATIRAGGHPTPRTVPTGGGDVPYWDAGRQYVPYAQGYYNSYAGVLPAIMVGTMMGSMFMHAPAMGADGVGGGGLEGGDFGGGDLGGGDFGGGFGGGDFGF